MGVNKVNIPAISERIKNNEEILPENKNLIFDFQRYLEINDYTDSRIYKYLVTLPKLAEQLNIPFNSATKEDIEKLVLWVNRRRKIGDTTKLHYRIMLKRFYKWLNGDEEYPQCVKFIKTTEKVYNKKLPKNMLNPQDLENLLKGAISPRNRAFIIFLWETGGRAEEILTLKVGDIEDHKQGMKVVVKGKKGSRRLMLIESVPYILDWLKSHPNREDENAPLWINIGAKNNGEPVKYNAMLKMLKLTAKKIGLKKPVHFHNFRHSRATYMANKFTESQLCEWFGWVQGSRVPARYVHLSGRDIDDAYLKMYGIKESEKDENEDKLKIIKCPRCGFDNGSVHKYCGRCGMTLDLKTAMKEKNLTDKLDEIFVKILDDPAIKAKIMEKLEEIGNHVGK